MERKIFFLAVLLLLLLVSSLIFPEYLYSPGRLNRKHSNITKCEVCHEPFTKPSGSSCVSVACHDKPYWDKRKEEFTGHLKREGCIACHTEHLGLSGKITPVLPHRGVSVDGNCSECHRTLEQHAPVKKQGCGKCHSMQKWKPARFDHRQSKEKGACLPCHPLPPRHFGTKGDCRLCHRPDKWKPAEFDHAALTGDDPCTICHPLSAKHFKTSVRCVNCHDTKAWWSANFKHTFPMQHGKRYSSSPCEACHPETTDKYDCYSACHEHAPSKIEREHLKHRIMDYGNCVKCHPTGREHESGRGEGSGENDGERDDD